MSSIPSSRKPLSVEFAPGQSPSVDYFVRILQPYKPILSPIPFVLFVSESCLATFCYFTYSDSDPFLKLMLGQLLAVNTTLAGLLHFFPPLFDFYTSMIFLPFKKFWLYLTGVTLIFGGIGICFQITQVLAAKCLTLTIIAMFPGNVFCVFNARAKQLVFGGSTTKALIRLPFQIPLVIWAWWYIHPTI